MKITVKLFGTLQLDTGVREMQLDVKEIKDIYAPLYKEAKEKRPETPVTEKDLKDCLIAVNGVRASKKAKLNDGDIVYLMTAVAGG